MPWKGETDPYKIWLSEIILQQTRVAQGLPYFNRFVQAYPTIQSLAEAPDTAVFKLWEGLGYYSRCRNLLSCARQVITEYQGNFPRHYNDIIKLKGIGPYTAAAIASFAFGLPHAVVDGNVIRVLARYFGIETAFDTTAGKKLFANLAAELLDRSQPAAYNQAIMDFGAVVCTPAEPACHTCVFAANCVAFKTQMVKQLPVKEKKLVKKNRYFHYYLIRAGNEMLVRQRLAKDIWQGLHEFYLVESNSAGEWEQVSVNNNLPFLQSCLSEISIKGETFKQQLTHQNINARFTELLCKEKIEAPEGYQWMNAADISHLAFPQIINSYLVNASKAKISLF